MDPTAITSCLEEVEEHLSQELLPFWMDRMMDQAYGGYLTHFDQYGKEVETDEKSLIAQSRSVFTLSSAHRAGWGGGLCADMARKGVDFLLGKMWDTKHGGFYWMCNRKGEVFNKQKILYGHSFAIYSLSEYTLATGDPRGLEYAQKVFDLLQVHALDSFYGGYYDMFEENWDLAGPGSKGGDRKTLDSHMHLMEAFTTLYEASQKPLHKRKLKEIIQLLLQRMLHPDHQTPIPMFWPDWQVAPQIKFDIIWGWDRYTEEGQKAAATDNTSYGHNVEFAWLLLHALRVLEEPLGAYVQVVKAQFDHAVEYGIDLEFGGVYVEGSHQGEVYDREKEFWQQAEVLIGMLDAFLLFEDPSYWESYEGSPLCL